jgi:hypothetical protein
MNPRPSHLPSPAMIAEYHGVDRRRFEEEIRPLCQPAVFRGIATDWPAVQAAKRSASDMVDHLKQYGPRRQVAAIIGAPEIAGRFFYTDDVRAMNFTRGTCSLDDFLDRLLRDQNDPKPYAIAVQSEGIADLLPSFLDQNSTTLLDGHISPRIWIGNRIRVAAHNDLQENIGYVVAGRRRFTLFPPEQIANLYPGPLELTPAGTPISMVELANPDLERFPRFADAWKTAQVAELAPGDAIYIPYHWWHAVDSLETVNVFVNYWWNDAPAGLGGGYDALMHALLAYRHLPPEQRDVWRTVLDHYVFLANGDPVEHLPPHARGVFGPLSPSLLGRMRATLLAQLKK